MRNMTAEEKDLHLRVRELDAENRQLTERVAELEETVLGYQYRLGEKQEPPKEITLKEYIALLNDPSTKGDTIDNGNESGFIVTDAVFDFDFSEGFWARLCNLGFHSLNVHLSYTDDNGKNRAVEFVYYCSKRRQTALRDKLNPFKGAIHSVIVCSTSTKYHFASGLIKENGEKIYFDYIH